MEKQRPFGVTLLAILALLAMLAAVYHALQMLGILPFTFGEMKFFAPEASWISALLWGILAAIYIWVFTLLWNVKPEGWLFVVVVAALNLIMAALSILGASTFGALLPSIIFNALVLLYCLLPSTRAAFGT
jgi:hypothetical protein